MFVSVFFLGSTANAQFNKPLEDSNKGPKEAKYNVGLIGGGTWTHWFHFGGTETAYHQPFNIGPTFGLTVERMFDPYSSIAIEALYTMRNTHLDYLVLNFPVAINVNKDFYRQYDVNYTEINIQVPLTYYFSRGKIRPYAFIAPRFTLPLSGKMSWQKREIIGYGTENEHYSDHNTVDETVEMTAQNMRGWNVGLVIGGGVRFKIAIGDYYYFLIRTDASVHGGFINSFSQEENNGDSQVVIGAAYIDPYLMQKRFNTDLTVRASILFPIKKIPKGTCMKWGEYD